ncbi:MULTISPECIES: glycoside hydrolase family 108 protein [Agrobacterium tumefaciens complex]|uniref:Secretion activator protein n=1 Tax=Agrobacterium tomkonis CFBP 6623 TaxID=1183432 RepID=A0A1S7PFA0_9HYPH|nr:MULTISPECIES: glycosyl hydrolase 108 family protein [Agrobacterium tumefaciens complex]QCL88722.1 secretion activator protein [Agrobacterium tumefaciens]CUX20420.1 Secretion activator protein [Agrobacterium tomkonis CFBP 6623]
MTDRFEICQAVTGKWEGGWSDHPDDPGGKTMYGITEIRWHQYQDKMSMKRTPVRNITMAQALKFYRSEFWLACGADKLFPGVDLAVYDASVNSGVSRGRKWLLASAGSNDHSETVKKICRARLSFMQSLKIWKTFGKGWGRRVADIEARGVAMALAAMGLSPSQVSGKIKTEATQSAKQASSAKKAATTSATAASAPAAASVVEPSTVTDATTVWILVAIVAAGAVATVIFIAKKRAADARVEAYNEVAA